MNASQAGTYWLGLDLGGTKMAGGIVAFPGGQLVSIKKIPTLPARSAQEILDDCLALATELIGNAPARVRGIGIGLPELVDLQENITSQETLPWQGFDLRGAFLHLAPAVIEADVRAAAFAEAHYGAGRPFDSFGYITIGTGISACLVQGGVPYKGTRGNALALGSSVLARSAEGPFILERYASGLALVTRYNAVAKTPVDSGQAVFAAMDAGDEHARAVVESAADACGLGIALYVSVIDPQAIVVGGGLGSADGVYWERAVASARANIYAENARELPILHAELGANAGIIGAAALAQNTIGDG